MKIGVIGAGYVGITTGICLASKKNSVTIFDIDSKKINQISCKKMPFLKKDYKNS